MMFVLRRVWCPDLTVSSGFLVQCCISWTSPGLNTPSSSPDRCLVWLSIMWPVWCMWLRWVSTASHSSEGNGAEYRDVHVPSQLQDRKTFQNCEMSYHKLQIKTCNCLNFCGGVKLWDKNLQYWEKKTELRQTQFCEIKTTVSRKKSQLQDVISKAAK